MLTAPRRRDVLERHLLRLGSGVEKLAEFTDGRDFSKFGRVNFTLERRKELLAEVQRLADSLAIDSGDVGYTCEAAAFFHLYHVTSRIEAYEAKVAAAAAAGETGAPQRLFPFAAFFADAPPGSMWAGGSDAADLDCARGCFRHLSAVFDELADFRAFELLRNHKMRSNYLLLKQASSKVDGGDCGCLLGSGPRLAVSSACRSLDHSPPRLATAGTDRGNDVHPRSHDSQAACGAWLQVR